MERDKISHRQTKPRIISIEIVVNRIISRITTGAFRPKNNIIRNRSSTSHNRHFKLRISGNEHRPTLQKVNLNRRSFLQISAKALLRRMNNLRLNQPVFSRNDISSSLEQEKMNVAVSVLLPIVQSLTTRLVVLSIFLLFLWWKSQIAKLIQCPKPLTTKMERS